MSVRVVAAEKGCWVTVWPRADDASRYTRLILYKGRSGIYVPLQSASGNTSANLAATVQSTLFHGHTAVFRVDGQHDVTVTFNGADPFTPTSVAAAINNASSYLSSSVYLDRLITIETSSVGIDKQLEVVGGSAIPLLALSLGETAQGNVAAFALGSSTSFTLLDPYGTSTDMYKYRMESDVALSNYSDPVSASPFSISQPETVVLGYLRLMDAQGKPRPNATVVVHNSFTANVGGLTVMNGSVYLTTDADGYAEVTLVRGVELLVVAAGADKVRRVTVPVDPSVSSFDLFGPEYGQDDDFNVQVPVLNYATRRSL